MNPIDEVVFPAELVVVPRPAGAGRPVVFPVQHQYLEIIGTEGVLLADQLDGSDLSVDVLDRVEDDVGLGMRPPRTLHRLTDNQRRDRWQRPVVDEQEP